MLNFAKVSYVTCYWVQCWRSGQLKGRQWLLVQIKVSVALVSASPSPIQHRQTVYFPSIPKLGTVRRKVPMVSPPEPLLLPMDGSQFFGGASRRQNEVMVTFSAAMKSLGICSLWGNPGEISFWLFSPLPLNPEALPWLRASSVSMWISSLAPEMKVKRVDGKVVADLDKTDWTSCFQIGIRKNWGQ